MLVWWWKVARPCLYRFTNKRQNGKFIKAYSSWPPFSPEPAWFYQWSTSCQTRQWYDKPFCLVWLRRHISPGRSHRCRFQIGYECCELSILSCLSLFVLVYRGNFYLICYSLLFLLNFSFSEGICWEGAWNIHLSVLICFGLGNSPCTATGLSVWGKLWVGHPEGWFPQGCLKASPREPSAPVFLNGNSAVLAGIRKYLIFLGLCSLLELPHFLI